MASLLVSTFTAAQRRLVVTSLRYAAAMALLQVARTAEARAADFALQASAERMKALQDLITAEASLRGIR